MNVDPEQFLAWGVVIFLTVIGVLFIGVLLAVIWMTFFGDEDS